MNRGGLIKTSAWAVILCLLTCLLAGCGDTIHGKSIAEPAVTVFHSELDDGNYSAVYSNASEDFQKAVTEEKLNGLLAAIHRKLGNVVSSTNTDWNVNTYNFKTRVELVPDTRFEQGSGTETFTFQVSDGKAVLMGYNINSYDMMVK